MIKAFPFIHQPDQVVQKTIDVSAADCQYQTHKKKSYFFMYVVTTFLRAGNPCITP